MSALDRTTADKVAADLEEWGYGSTEVQRVTTTTPTTYAVAVTIPATDPALAGWRFAVLTTEHYAELRDSL